LEAAADRSVELLAERDRAVAAARDESSQVMFTFVCASYCVSLLWQIREQHERQAGAVAQQRQAAVDAQQSMRAQLAAQRQVRWGEVCDV
jgi:hypothetical protein